MNGVVLYGHKGKTRAYGRLGYGSHTHGNLAAHGALWTNKRKNKQASVVFGIGNITIMEMRKRGGGGFTDPTFLLFEESATNGFRSLQFFFSRDDDADGGTPGGQGFSAGTRY